MMVECHFKYSNLNFGSKFRSEVIKHKKIIKSKMKMNNILHKTELVNKVKNRTSLN